MLKGFLPPINAINPQTLLAMLDLFNKINHFGLKSIELQLIIWFKKKHFLLINC